MSQNPIQDAREIFNIQRWGDGYFDINEEGHVVVFTTGRRDDGAIDLRALRPRLQYNRWRTLRPATPDRQPL